MKKYLEIYQKLKNDMISGAIKRGAKLPSKRILADSYGVSVITVEHAVELLESEGYVIARERSGYYSTYSSDVTYLFSAPQQSIENTEIVSAVTATNTTVLKGDLTFPYTEYARTVRAVLNDYGDELLKIKPTFSGTEELKTAIKDYLKRNRNLTVETKNIVIGAGAEYLYGLIADTLKGDVFGIEDPSYEKIEKIYSSRGVKTDNLKMGGDGILTSELLRTNATVLHVTPFKSYPTLTSATISKKKEYLHLIVKRGGYFIEDDYAQEFSPVKKFEDTIYSLDKSENDGGRVIYVNSFTKTVSPSLRIGYMILPDSLRELCFKTVGFYTCPVPILEQFILARILNDGSFERHVNKMRRALLK